MKLVTTEMLIGLNHINALAQKTQNQLLREVDEVIEPLVTEMAMDEALAGLKLCAAFDYVCRVIHLEEIIDGLWDMYVAGGVEQEISDLIEKGWLLEEQEDEVDYEDNLYTDMKEIFFRMMKGQYQIIGIDDKTIDFIGRAIPPGGLR